MSASPNLQEQFEVLEQIGRGSFGSVHKVRRLTDGKILVRKEISYMSMNPKERSQLIAEFRILRGLTHPNIVQYYYHDHLPDQHMVHLYMEFCDGGDLAGVIRKCKSSGNMVPEDMVWSIFSQLVLALYRCHFGIDPPPVGPLFSTSDPVIPKPDSATVVIHRDIKPANVFLLKDNFVKLGDFGLAKMLGHEAEFATTYVGTPYYMSPEVLKDQPYTPLSDIWSLGCVMYELCALHPPFQAKTHMQLSQRIQQGSYPPIPSTYSQTLAMSIRSCLRTEATKRPSSADLLQLAPIKLCRKELEVAYERKKLSQIEEALRQKEILLIEEERRMNFQLQEFKNRAESEFQKAVEQEVSNRLNLIAQQFEQQQRSNNKNANIPSSALRNISRSYSNSPLNSPIDVTMTMTPSPSNNNYRAVKGPREPSSQAYETPSRGNRVPLGALSDGTVGRTKSLTDSSDQKDHNRGNSNHYHQLINGNNINGGMGLGAAAARMRIQAGNKTPNINGNFGKMVLSDINNKRRDSYDEIPSPFLKKKYER